jgi:malonate-semialdehyde dehydrogenase (acetylating)/methylmalonate-semialdehyde dehydrogenase
MSQSERLQFFAGGQWCDSQTAKYADIYDPSTGAVIAQTPCCTEDEVQRAIRSAAEAFPAWSNTPALKRADVLFKFRERLDQHMDELTHMVCREHGKVWEEAKGDVLKAREATGFACGAPSLMTGESLMNASSGFDTVLYREPVGVFAGIAPLNFPAMIPMGWILPLCIATGNTLVLKPSNVTPMTSMRCLKLLQEAGLPDGVVNLVTCDANEAELLLRHPDVKGVTFVGSAPVGAHVYATAAAHGKRVQALCGAKNHALVLEDASLERTARGIINGAFGCAGERCMALPVVVAQDSIADQLCAMLVKFAGELKVGPAYDKSSELGPMVTDDLRQRVLKWIDRGIQEGANLVRDGRSASVKGFEKGFFLGPTIFDHVTPDMTVGNEEIFGPVLCIKRVKSFEAGLALMNSSRFANGSVIFTQNGYYSREFARHTHAGMVGINVGIPVPVGMFPFSGHKSSFIGDLHVLGHDGIRFYTETKVVTTRWFDDEESKKQRVGTWD